MPDLTPFWRSLEALIGCATVARQWKDLTGDQYELARQFLRPSGQLATFYPHPDPGICVDRVVTHGPDEHVAVCDETGERLVLTTEDLVLWKLDRGRLGRALAEAFGLRHQEEPVEELPDVVRIGYDVPLAGYCFPAFLAIASPNRRFPEVLHRLRADGLRVWFDEWEIGPGDSLCPGERARVEGTKEGTKGQRGRESLFPRKITIRQGLLG